MKNLIRSNDRRDLNPWSALRNEMYDLFDRFSSDIDFPLSSSQDNFVPRIETRERGDGYRISVEVPGMDEKDINISLRENSLIIEGEKKSENKQEDKDKGFFRSEFSYGRFYRAIPLEDDVDAEKITASYKNGVLLLDVKKKPEGASKARKIEISSGDQKSLKH